MYAIFETGGKQYKVKKGDMVDVELLKDGIADNKVEFKNILFLNDGTSPKVGSPFLEKASISGEFVQQVKGPKVIAYKYKRRKNFRKKIGHRQKYSRVKITDITFGE